MERPLLFLPGRVTESASLHARVKLRELSLSGTISFLVLSVFLKRFLPLIEFLPSVSELPFVHSSFRCRGFSL